MATRTVTQTATAETLNRREAHVSDAATAHAYARSILKEWEDEIAKIYSVASAGTNYCNRETTPIERSLFLVIESLAAEAFLPRMLTEKLNELAKLAGVELSNG